LFKASRAVGLDQVLEQFRARLEQEKIPDGKPGIK